MHWIGWIRLMGFDWIRLDSIGFDWIGWDLIDGIGPTALRPLIQLADIEKMTAV